VSARQAGVPAPRPADNLDSETVPVRRDDHVVAGALLHDGLCETPVLARNRSPEATVLQAAAFCGTRWTSLIRPVFTSKIKPRTGTSLAIHGCDLTFSICSRVFCSGSL
jgi:hypothetical protein